MATVKANGVELYYETAGSGPSVVLVHGSWGDADNWAPVLPMLAKGCTAVSYDRRGHSRSELAPGSVTDDVADLAALIDALDLAPAYVCGNSFGALITLRLVATHPDLVRGFAVHEPPGVPLLMKDPGLAAIAAAFGERIAPVEGLLEAGENAAAAELFVESIAFGPGQWAQLPAPMRETFVRNAPTYLEELHDRAALAVDLDALSGYTGPALLTGGGQSPPLFAPILEQIAARMPQAERHLYSGAGHVPHATHPAEYTQVTLERALR